MTVTTTTLKISRKLKARVVRLAKQSDRTPHSFMIKAISREVEHGERCFSFIDDATAADCAVTRGAPVYAVEDVHAWMKQFAAGKKARRPTSLSGGT